MAWQGAGVYLLEYLKTVGSIPIITSFHHHVERWSRRGENIIFTG
jgi:hypothetical protein